MAIPSHVMGLLPGDGEGVLRVCAGGVRRRRTIADTSVCAVDLDLGMNNWMSEPFEYPEKPIRAGQGTQRGTAYRTWRIRTLQGRRRRRDSVSHTAWHRPSRSGLPLLAALATMRRLCTPSGLKTTRQHAAPGAEVRDRKDTGSEAGRSKATRQGEGWHYCLRHQPLCCRGEPRTMERENQIATDYLRVRASHLRRRSTTLWPA